MWSRLCVCVCVCVCACACVFVCTGLASAVGRRGGAPAPALRSPYENIKGPKPMIVLDAPNVAMRHGRGKKFSCAGIQYAIMYYQSRGHRVLAILPERYLDSEHVALLRRAAEKVCEWDERERERECCECVYVIVSVMSVYVNVCM